MTQLKAANQKPSYSMMPKLCVNFSFYPILTNFSKINQSGEGVDCCCSFLIEMPPNILKMKKIFLCLKIAEIDMGDQFWVEKNGSGHKKTYF